MSNLTPSDNTQPSRKVAKGKLPQQSAQAPATTSKAAPKASSKQTKATTAKTDAQSSLQQARQAVESFAQVNAAQAHELGVQLADAEAAFPLAMMSAYQSRKDELRAGGLDTGTFLAGLTEQVTALKETSITIALPTTSGAALPPGTTAEA